MNRIRLRVWVVVGLALLIMATWLLERESPFKGNAEGVALPSGRQSGTTSAITLSMGMTSSQSQSQPPSPSVNVSPVVRDGEWRAAALAHNVPIDFWGKVIDQNGNPVGGVSIVANTRTFVVQTNNEPTTSSPRTNVVTSAYGLFEITGLSGDALTIETIKKDGYEAEQGAFKTFNFNPALGAVSSMDNPVFFRLWTNGLQQSLISGQKMCEVIPDGRPYALDLFTGTVTEAKGAEGDLQFWLKRPNNAGRSNPYNWSFGVRPEGGSILQEFGGEYADMTIAPQDGYANLYASNHAASDTDWVRGETDDRFFVRIRDGQVYGKVLIKLDSFFNAVKIQYAVNPSGSPILR